MVAAKISPAKNPKQSKTGRAKSAGTAPPAPESRNQEGAKTTVRKRRKLSALGAAAKVLAEQNQPMTTRQMIEAMAAKGYWKSPGGKTPHATLYSAILREIGVKGPESRFIKTERGKFTAMA